MESILSGHDGERDDTSVDFDTLFDTKALRIMRVLIPFFPAPYQPMLAVWIRFAQLKHALTLLKSGHFTHGAADPSTTGEDLLTRLIPALKPCLSESEYQELVRMQNVFAMYQRFQQIMPYLSALNGMSGDSSAADMMNLFQAMQGGDDSSAADLWSAFSSMQNSSSSEADTMSAASDMQDSGTDDTDHRHTAHSDTKASASQSTQSTGSGMDMNSILNLISLFQSSAGTSDDREEPSNTSERQDEPEHEQRLDER